MDFKIAVLAGDGIGPEISAVGVDVMTAVCEKFGTISLFSLGIHELARRIAAFQEMTNWE